MNYGLLLLLVFFSFFLLRLFSSNKRSVMFMVFPEKKVDNFAKNINCNVDFICDKWSNIYQNLVVLDKEFNWCNFSNVFYLFHDKVISNFASGKKKDLMNYMSGDLLQDFYAKINDREEKDLIQHTDIVSSKINKIENITIKGKSKAIFDVQVSDKIISFLEDKDGNTVQGSKNIISYEWIWTIVGDVIDGSFQWHVKNISKSL